MANHVSHAALPYPVKGCRYSLLVPYLDADGDPTDPTTPDTERSIDAAAFADCAEEVTTITGANGMGYITLTGDELNGSLIAVAAKVASGPKNTLATIHPRVLPVLYSGTASAGAASSITLATDIPAVADLLIGCIVRTTGGTGGGGGSGSLNNQARVITDFTTGRVATVVPNWETTPDATTTYEVLLTEGALIRFADVQLWRAVQPNALVSSRVDASVGAMAADVVTAAAIANGAIDAATFAAGAIDNAAFNVTETLTANPAAGGIVAASFGAGAIDAAAIATDAIGAAELAAGAVDEIVNAVFDELTAEARTAGSYGQLLKDNLNATVSSRTVPGDLMGLVAGAITAAKFAAGAIDAAAIANGAIDAATFAAGAIDAAAIGTGAITAAKFAAGAIDAAAIANAAIDAATFAAGAIDAAAIATGAIDADAIADNAIDAGALAAGAITAAKIATDAIGSAQLAQSAADKIIASVSGTADAGGSTTTIVDAERTEADTDYWAGSIVLMTSGPNVGQVRRISAFNFTTDTLTVASAFTQAVATGNTYLILRSSALEAPGAGATDWTAAEKNQIRDALGVDGTKAAALGGQLQVIDDFIDTEVAAIKAKTDQLTFTIAGKVDSSIQAAGDFAQAAADKVWSSAARTLTSFGTLVSDIWANATRTLSTLAAATIEAAAANKLADHVLRRTYANARASSDGDALSFRSLLGAIGKLVNKWAISGTTLTIYQEDDLTSTAPGGTQTITATPGADPITTLDTN